MKFVVSTQELNYLVSKCLNVASQRSTLPVLSHVMFQAKNGEVVLTATDLTIGIRCFAQAKILEEGSTMLPARKLASLLKELAALNVEVKTHENHVTEITANSSYFRLNGMSTDEFPELPNFSEAQKISLTEDLLKDMFFRTSFAVAKDDERIELTGVFLHVENKALRIVGTDGKRLARVCFPVDIDPSFCGDYIIPLKAIEEVQKTLKEEGPATMYLMKDKMGFETEDTLFVTKLLAGEYPDVSRVIPESLDQKVSLHREELMSLLRQVSLFTAETNQSMRFRLSPGELELSVNTADVGEGKVSMPVNYQGEELMIGFNPQYFLDIVRHTKGETISMGLIDPYNPGVITEEGEGGHVAISDATPLFVLMPVRL